MYVRRVGGREGRRGEEGENEAARGGVGWGGGQRERGRGREINRQIEIEIEIETKIEREQSSGHRARPHAVPTYPRPSTSRPRCFPSPARRAVHRPPIAARRRDFKTS